MTPGGSPTGSSRQVSFETLAVAVMVVALVVVAIVAVAVVPVAVERGSIPIVVAVGGVLLSAALPALALRGLWLHAPWQIEVAIIALAFLVLTGVLDVVAGLAKGTITFPLLAIAALIVLWRRPTEPRPAGHGPITGLAVALGTAALLWGPVTGAALRPGSPLVVDESALELRTEVDCFVSGVEPGPPLSVGITTTWTWNDTEPLPWGSDAVLIEWQMTDEDGGESSPYRRGSLELPDGAIEGEGPSPASDVIDRELAELGPQDGYVSFWLDLGTDGMRDGTAEITLEAPIDVPAHGSLFAVTTFVHRDAWQVRSVQDDPTGGGISTCFW